MTNSRRVTFGLRLPNSGPLASPEAIFQAAQIADSLRYDSVWVHDHISWPREQLSHFATGSVEACKDQNPDLYDCLITMASLIGLTRKINLGIAAIVVPARDPRVLARQVLTLNALSGGRLILGMSIGNIHSDFEVMGIPWNKRGKITNDYLAALDALLSESPISEYHGEFIQFENASYYPKPRNLRRWIAASSAPGLERAAKWGEGWFVAMHTPEEYASMKAGLFELLDKYGKDKTSFICGLETFIAVEDTMEEAVRTSKASLEGWGGKGIKNGLKTCIIGDAERSIEQINNFIKNGVQNFELRIIAHSMEHYRETARRIAEDVLPKTLASG